MDEAEYRGRLNAIEDGLTVLYRQRRQLTAEYAHDHRAVLPPATRRTEKQALIARCPRCGDRLDGEIESPVERATLERYNALVAENDSESSGTKK